MDDEETGEIKWSKRMASLPLGVSDASGRVIVENAAQIRAESDDKIIVGAHERGLFALPYTASAGEGLRDGSDGSNALVAASESEDFVRVDIGSDEDDWSCIPEDLVKATLDKTSSTSSRLPGSMNVATSAQRAARRRRVHRLRVLDAIEEAKCRGSTT